MKQNLKLILFFLVMQLPCISVAQNNFISTTREPSNNRGLGLLMSRGYNIRGSSHNHFKSSVPSGSDFITAEKVHQIRNCFDKIVLRKIIKI